MNTSTLSKNFLWILLFLLSSMQESHSTVITYPTDNSNSNIPKSDIYEVTVSQNGQAYSTMIYKSVSNGSINGGRNVAVHNSSISWTNFSFSGTVTVRVKLKSGQNKVTYGTDSVFPSKKNITTTKIDNQTLEFTLKEAGQFSVEFSNVAYNHGLMIFADPLETRAAPTGADVKICNPCKAADLQNLTGKTAIYFKDNSHDIGIYVVPTNIKKSTLKVVPLWKVL